MTDTGIKFDGHKPMMDLLPPKAELEVAKVLTFGATKYSPDNWRLVPSAKTRYLAASMRHCNAYRQGENTDPESGIHHLAHAITSLMFVLELEMEDNVHTN